MEKERGSLVRMRINKTVPVHTEVQALQKYLGVRRKKFCLMLVGTQSHCKVDINVGGALFAPIQMSMG